MSDHELRELERRARSGDVAARVELSREQERRGLPSRAVIGCVHANLEALTAVLADIERRGIHDIVCLGDLVGYGPSPVECVELVRERCRVVLQGFSDEAVFVGTSGWGSPSAARALTWSRSQLRSHPELLTFLRKLPVTHEDGRDLFKHSSPLERGNIYLSRSELEQAGDAQHAALFAAFRSRLFVAHTHVPGAFTIDRTWYDAASSLTTQSQVIVNVGSVGQPRDRDIRACYVTITGPTVTWHRVDYDVEATIRRIEAARLPELQGRRLRQGL